MRAWELYEEKGNILEKIPQDILDKLNFIRWLFQPTYEIRLVGGAPRDILMKKTPKDYDLSTTSKPEITMKIGNDYNKNPDNKYNYISVIATGLQHGTVTYSIDGDNFEITTLRTDIETDGRHAEVNFKNVTWEQDAARRDLTRNSISIDLDGQIYDYFGGVSDIRNDIVKFVGDADKRMQEDYLRILRYFRFQGRTANPNFDRETIDAIERNAKGLERISGERIWMEMSKILSGNHLMEILKKIGDTGVDLFIDLPAYDSNIVRRTKKNTDNAAVLLGAMMQSENQVDRLAARWKFKTYDRELMRFIVNNRFGRFTEDEAKDMWTNPKIKNEYVVELAKYFGKPDLATKLQNWEAPIFPVTGKMLLDVGLKPGPQIGVMLARLEKEWKDSGYKKEWTPDELKVEVDEIL